MNKDLDERLLPNGQYKHALNVEISTSEDNSVGTLQNILGSKRLDELSLSGFKCVGTIADEKTNKLYWLVSSYSKDAILEYNVDQDIVNPVVVDLNASNSEAVLKFSGNIITGINIINNLLYWTDNNSEPKKINIDECKKGTKDFNTHTQLIFPSGSFWGITCYHVSMSTSTNLVADPFNENGGRFVWFEKKQMDAMVQRDVHVAHLFDDPNESSGEVPESVSSHWFIRHYRNNEFLGIKKIRVYTENTDSSSNDGDPTKGTFFRTEPYGADTLDRFEFKKDDVIFGHSKALGGWQSGDAGIDNPDGITIPIQEKHITVIKPKPLKALSVKVNFKKETNKKSSIPNLFEETFPRFSYRYKYKDNEFSAFAPFTEPVFNPQYPQKQKKSSNGPNVFYKQDDFYDIKEPSNKAMINSIHSIELMDFINAQTPEDVVEVEILYKKEDSPIIYSIDVIKHTDAAWHRNSYHEGHDIGLDQGLGVSTTNIQQTTPASSSNFTQRHPVFYADGGLLKGRYEVTTENIYSALPANQLLRPYDNVPRRALSQEVTGNRIVYGNYLQNYDLGSYSPKLNIRSVIRNVSSMDTWTTNTNYYFDDTGNLVVDNIGKIPGEIKNKPSSFQTDYLKSHDSGGLPSIKSQRNYQVGVVYCDKHGRETPVFTSQNGAVHVPWQDEDGTLYASKVSQLEVSTLQKFPTWVDHVKFFIKESSNDYYNLVMSRAWLNKRTYDLDNSEEHLWISFPSSDRNKITEEDYIVLKKLIGVGEHQVESENKFKILGISNEAPDAVKYRLANLGVASGTILDGSGGGSNPPQLFTNRAHRVDKVTDNLILDFDVWTQDSSLFGINLAEEADASATLANIAKHLYINWRLLDNNGNGPRSTRYRIVGITPVGGASTTIYNLRLASAISQEDADLAHKNSDSASGNSGLDLPTGQSGDKGNLIVQIERKEEKDLEDFSGSFFVKISKNTITESIEIGTRTDVSKSFHTVASHHAFWWKDDTATGNDPQIPNTTTNDYGVTNTNGYQSNYPLGNNEGSIQNETNNETGNISANNTNIALKLTDNAEAWEGIFTRYNGPQFFIDNMHMVAGQSDTSTLAKFCTVTWAGSQYNVSAWDYPAPMMWITDFLKTPDAPKEEDATDILTEYRHLLYINRIRRTVPHDGSASPGVAPRDTTYGAFTHESKTDGSAIAITGWVGADQTPRRRFPTKNNTWDQIRNNHVNALEGIVTTNIAHKRERRWFSGLDENSKAIGHFPGAGAGREQFIYSTDNETIGDRHFLHLSFFAPGKNLIDKSDFPDNFTLIGDNSIGNNLQGVWGGGNFTTPDKGVKLGTSSTTLGRHHGIDLEGNVDSSNKWQPERPGPGVGYGYNLAYEEKHSRQWDPTFNDLSDDDNKKIKEFLANLFPGSKFKFSTDSSSTPTIYTIVNVTAKRLYNHTSWRETWNRAIKGDSDPAEIVYHSQALASGYIYAAPTGDTTAHCGFYTQQHLAYRSVEHQALRWLETVDAQGNTNYTNSTEEQVQVDLKQKLEDFGAAHNRRVCYIIELDKDPTAEGNYNPLASDMNANRGQGGISGPVGINSGDADYGGSNIQFITPTQSILLHELNKFPAIWETSPKKLEADLDIYYEASSAIPVKLNEKTNELFAPLGCRVEIIDGPIEGVSYLKGWDGRVAYIEPGFARGDGSGEYEYTGVKFKFIRKDGSYTVGVADENQLIGQTQGFKTNFVFREDIGNDIIAGLGWYNCFSFGNGIESNRIRDDFNQVIIGSGVKASTRLQDTYEQERRRTGLIFSGIYNSNSGINDLNQFIMAENITKDLNPTYGSIQKLFQRRISLIAFCEDRVISITSNKDTIFNADGNPQLVASNKVLGDATPFVGEYGISKNPESFASESYRAYFTDKQRGAVLRLSKDGLTPISSSGMHDYFRDNLKEYSSLIGTYDKYKQDYNLTLSFENNENLVVNQYFEQGSELIPMSGSLLNHIQNHEPTGISLQYPWEEYNVDSVNTNQKFAYGIYTHDYENLHSQVKVINHPTIPKGHFQQAKNQLTTPNPDTVVTPATDSVFRLFPQTYAVMGDMTQVSGSGTLTNNGRIVEDPIFKGGIANDPLGSAYQPINIIGLNSSFNGFGTYNTRARLIRYINGVHVNSNYTLNQTTSNWLNYTDGYSNNTSGSAGGYFYPTPSGAGRLGVAEDDDRRLATLRFHNKRGMVWDRLNTGDKYNNSSVKPDGTLGGSITASDHYLIVAPRDSVGNNNVTKEIAQDFPGQTVNTNTMFHGDEIRVTVKIKAFQSGDGAANHLGYNVIRPVIELVDGNNNTLDPTYLTVPSQTSTNALDANINPIGNLAFQNSYEKSMDQLANATIGYGLINEFGQIITASDPSFPNESWYSGPGSNKLKNLYHTKSYPTNPIVTFPTSVNSYFTNLQTGDAVTPGPGVSSPNYTDHLTQDVEYGYQTLFLTAYFKFVNPANVDPATGNAFDTYTSVAVEDLRIKIYQTEQGDPLSVVSGNYSFSTFNTNSVYPPNNYDYRRGYQFWAVDDVMVEKQAGAVENKKPAVTTPNPDTITQFAQPDIPLATVPGWVEVNHLGFKGWEGTIEGGGNGGYGTVDNVYIEGQLLSSGYGLNPGRTLNTYGLLDQAASVNAQTPIVSGNATWYTPTDSTPGNQASLPSHPHPDPPGSGTLSTTSTVPSEAIVDYNNDFWYIKTGSNAARDLTYFMPNDTWEVGKYYLVDVEFDETHNYNTGGLPAGGANGDVYVWGTHDNPSNYTHGDPLTEEDEVGLQWGTGSVKHVRLVPHVRKEYPPNQTKRILRGIFKMRANAELILNNSGYASNNMFKLRFGKFTNSVKITRVILKKLDHLNNSGTSHNWTNWDNDINGPHSFSERETYFQSDGLCFDTNADSGNFRWYRQVFEDYASTPATRPRPKTTPGGWKFNFNVTNNPRTGNVTGKFLILIHNKDGDSSNANEFEGIMIDGITTSGSYSAYFNMDGSINGTSFTTQAVNINNFSPGQGWFVIDNATGNIASGITVGNSPLVADPAHQNRIEIRSDSNQDCAARFSSLELTDLTVVYTGGQSGAWQYNGFNTSTDDYILWEEVIDQNTGVSNQRLNFNNMPMIDPFTPSVPTELICASQYLNKTINRFEKYKIEFYHQITDGMIHIYYFNSNGFGFRLYDIDATTGVSDNNNIYYVEREVEIGQQEWEPINPINPAYAPEFKESLVIRMQASNQNIDVNGWIDGISMTKMIDNEDLEPTTVTYREDVGGWTSFKSFVPETGVSVSKNYFTFKDAGLYKHYVSQKYNEQTTNWEDCDLIHADNYNRFYLNYTHQSKIKLIFNNEPSTVKSFNAISYEGTQARIKKPTHTRDAEGNLNISSDQAQAWVLGGGNNNQNNDFEIVGWFCDSIKTNLETGSVHEFVKKEGKWFNYIKGATTKDKFDQKLIDTKRASVQGIGVLSQAEETTYEGEEDGA